MSTKIDFCGATGHDHGGWQVAAADGGGTKTTITMTMAATFFFIANYRFFLSAFFLGPYSERNFI
jgi:hypothetical protein